MEFMLRAVRQILNTMYFGHLTPMSFGNLKCVLSFDALSNICAKYDHNVLKKGICDERRNTELKYV